MPEQPFSTPVYEQTPISRRTVLAAGLAAGVALVTEACGSSSDPSLPELPENPDLTHDRLANASDEQLQKLGVREIEYGTRFDDLMVFTHMPVDEASAHEQADEIAGKLKEFAENGVKPYLLFEPTGPDETPLDLTKLPTGPFQTLLDRLKQEGVTGEQMGTVVVCPEANEPLWKDGNVDPENFKHNVTRLGGAVKSVFPEAKLGILLNSTSYTPDWQGSKAASALLPYVEGLKGIDELCFQGFPWSNDTVDPLKFLDAQTAITLAKHLGGPEKVALRFNTGTYNTQINPDTHENVSMDLGQRAQILDGIVNEVTEAKHAGYEVTLQIFNENKAKEEADWSYDATDKSAAVLKYCLDKARKQGVRTTVYG